MSRRAVFLDRDGVLVRTHLRDGVSRPPTSVAEVEILPGVPEALALLAAQGWLLIVVTNQPDVARGTQARGMVEAINAHLMQRLPLHAVYTCYHDTRDSCACRKPKPGLLYQAALERDVELGRSVMIGDRWSDVAAGAAAGCATVLIRSGDGEQPRGDPDHEVSDLLEAARTILGLSTRSEGRPAMPALDGLRVKIFADGADVAEMVELSRLPHIAGFTTNPTLMRKAGVADYRAFARDVLRAVPDRPISFEVFADEFDDMERQGHEIASWGPNVFVKIPVTNTRGDPSLDLIRRLAKAEVQVNVTALMTIDQVRDVTPALEGGPPSFVSVFAGRVADTGRDPVPMMALAVELLRPYPNQQLIWASPREALNIFQADAIGCHVITFTGDLLRKLDVVGKDLTEYSLETVRMFHRDAEQAGFRL